MTQLANQFRPEKEVGLLDLTFNPNIIDVKLNPFTPKDWDSGTDYVIGDLVFNISPPGNDLFYIATADNTDERPDDGTNDPDFWTIKTFPNVVPGTPVEAVPNVPSAPILVQTLSDITNIPLGFVIRDVKNPINESDFSTNSPNRDLRIAMTNNVMVLKNDSNFPVQRGNDVFVASQGFNTDDPRITITDGGVDGDKAIGVSLQFKQINELVLIYLFAPINF